jgi:hypothetical protein
MSDTVCFWVVGNKNIDKVNHFQLFPNPVYGELNITFDEFLNDNSYDDLQITNLLGEAILIDIIQRNQSSLKINTKNLAAGIYQLSINGVNKKFIKLE